MQVDSAGDASVAPQQAVDAAVGALPGHRHDERDEVRRVHRRDGGDRKLGADRGRQK